MSRRTWSCDFKQHDGTLSSEGIPTYEVDDDWTTVITAWPCEHLSSAGGEVIRGSQVNAVTTDVLLGEYYGGSDVTTDMRAVINGVTYEVVSVRDLLGKRKELRIELKKED